MVTNLSMFAKLKDWQRVFLCLVAVKTSYFVLVIGLIWVWPDYDESRARNIRQGWFPETEALWLEGQQTQFAKHFTTWDSAHYLVLCESGYFNGLRACAFYPLWPLTVRWLSDATGVSHLTAGMVLANLFSLIGWTLFWSIVSGRFNRAVAKWALVFLLCFPGSVFYQFMYTESLFFLLLMVLWFGLERRNYKLAFIAAILLPLSRAVGAFALLPILWHGLMHFPLPTLNWWPWLARERVREADRFNEGIKKPSMAGPVLLVAAPFLGLSAYFGLMWSWTGNAFEGFEAQVHWRAHSISNLWNLPKFFMGFFEPTSWHEFRGSILDRCGFMMLIYSLPLLWRLDKDLILWVCILGLVPAMSGTFISFIRFESVVFPLFIALGMLVTRPDNQWLKTTVGPCMILMHVVLLWRFLNYGWAG